MFARGANLGISHVPHLGDSSGSCVDDYVAKNYANHLTTNRLGHLIIESRYKWNASRRRSRSTNMSTILLDCLEPAGLLTAHCCSSEMRPSFSRL